MNRHYRIFITFALALVALFSTKVYFEHINSQKIRDLSIEKEAKSLTDMLMAFRETYQEVFLRNNKELDEHSIEFLPVKTSNEISRVFSSRNIKAKIETVSDNPRNPNNLANDRQLKAIKYFKENPNIKHLFRKEGNLYYYTKALYINQKCLKCHGKKEDAPKIISNEYSRSYGYKLGEIRGIIDIELQQTDMSTMIQKSNDIRMIVALAMLFLILIAGFWHARTNARLAKEVAKEIAKNKKREEYLIHQSRLAQMGEMIRMIAHQWRQPLNILSTNAIAMDMKIQLGKFNNDFFSQKIKSILTNSAYLSSTIDDFRDFFKSDKVKTEINYTEIVESALNIVSDSLSYNKITLIKELNCDKNFNTYSNELKQVILNLIKNSEDILIEKKPKNAYIKISTYEENKNLILEVADNGGGIPDNIINKVFDPYFSTKTKKDGTGLGLYMSKVIIEDHCESKLSVENSEDGAVFRIVMKR